MEIEDRLMKSNCRTAPPSLYLYDVTSSHLEGEHNFYGAFGYNRDGKKGKRQIVIGPLCDQDGAPLSIEVSHGNTGDVETFSSQIRKVKSRFGGGEVVLVGDRGMIKSEQVKDILGNGLHYITACTYQVVTDGKVLCQRIQEPRDSTARLIEAAGVIIPEVIVAGGIRATTRKKTR